MRAHIRTVDRDGLAGAGLAHVLDAGDEIAGLARAERCDGGVVGAADPDLVGVMGGRRLHEPEPVPTGPGVTTIGQLSDFHAPLAGGPAETPVFFLEGEEAGGKMVILGGVHPNEIAGVLAATIVLENAVVEQGEVIIVPRSNASGFTHNSPGQAVPSYINIPTPWGERRFRYGDRLVHPLHQFPDPDAHVHYQSGSVGHGSEARNLNRNFPGLPNGSLTEQIAWAITQLTDLNGADMLLGNGDMLFLPPGQSDPLRIQGAYLSTEETERLMNWYREQAAERRAQAELEGQQVDVISDEVDILEMVRASEASDEQMEADVVEDRDKLFRDAAELCIQHQGGSTSLLQRRLRIGYGRAARIIDQLHYAGVLGPPDGSKPREVLVDLIQLDQIVPED